MPKSPRAMNLQFQDPEQLAAIEAAARREGVSVQEFVLSAGYARATWVEQRFLQAFEASITRSGEAFTSTADSPAR
ncbi:hypothetical protein [Streptomyces sp. NPDC001975]